MAEKNTPILSPEYLDFRNEITSRIRSAQYEALKAVNKEMIALYWEIGRGPWAGENPSWRTFRGTYRRSFRV